MRPIDADELLKWISGQSKSPSCPKNESAFGLRIMKHIDRMLSAQSTHTDTSNTLKSLDCVDRQAVKEMMCVKHCTAYPTCQQKYGCYKTHDLELLPSVQPVGKDINVSCKDAISRQAAIDALDTGLWGVEWDKALATAMLKDLPSAQPDIICCKDCKHFEYDHLYVIHGVPVLGHELCNAWGDGCKTDENGYCFLAERRTDEPEK